MKAEEIEFIESEVKVNLMPEIKKAVPGVLAWVLRVVFPKLERKIINFVISIVEHFLSKKAKLPNSKTMEAQLCGGLPKPTYNQTPNGYWSCINGTWTWIHDLGLGV